MHGRPMETKSESVSTPHADGASNVALSIAGALALLSASCCVLPIVLSIVGVGGSWLAMLGPFVENRSVILPGVGVVLAIAWWRLLSRWRCQTVGRSGLIAATTASLLFAIALSTPLWEREVTKYMFQHWILPQ